MQVLFTQASFQHQKSPAPPSDDEAAARLWMRVIVSFLLISTQPVRKWRISPLHSACFFKAWLWFAAESDLWFMFQHISYLKKKARSFVQIVLHTPLRFIRHSPPQKQITKHLKSIWRWLVKVSHKRPHPRPANSWRGERSAEEIRKRLRAIRCWWLTGGAVVVLRRPMGGCLKGLEGRGLGALYNCILI